MAAASVVSSPSPTTSCDPAGQSLITPDAAEGEAVDLADAAFWSSSAMRWIPIGLIGFGVAHEREQAGPKRSRSERAAGEEAQAVADVRRQPG